MDKKEAYELFLKLHHECLKHDEKDCSTCPFLITKSRIEMCLLCNVHSKNIAQDIMDYLVKDEVEENPEEKLSAALAKAGSIIAQGINNTKEDIPTQKNIFVPSVNAKHDNVNRPKHYCKGGLECIQVIKAQLTPEQYKGYLYGNVLKYMWRWPEKNGLEDLQKAAKYLEWLQEEVKK